MITRIRVILPPARALIGFVALYLILEGPILYFEIRAGQPVGTYHPGVFIARVAALAYGIYRVRAFHPALLGEYRAWLERTPWTGRKPLPGGPVALSWADGLVIGALAAAVAGRGAPEILAVGSLVLIGHSLTLAWTLAATGPKVIGFLVAVGVGLAIRLWPDRTACLASAVTSEGIGWIGLQFALARFPWPNIPPAVNVEAPPMKSCGWPFDQLRPTVPASGWGRGPAVAYSVLAGWYFLAAEAVIVDLGWPIQTMRVVFAQFLMMMVFGRIAAYGSGYAPPIDLWGRLRMFRWIVPGYDQIFLAPMGVILIGLLAVDRFRPTFLTEEYALAIGLGLGLMVTTAAGPDLTRWRLTGHHRMVPSGIKKKGEELVKVG